MDVRDVMTRDPVTAGPDTTVGEVLDILQSLEVRHLPIVDPQGELVGLASDRDLRGLTFVEATSSRPTLLERLQAPIRTLMRRDNPVVEADAELGDVLDLMLEQRVGAVPVVHPGTRRLVGIISYVDVLRLVQKVLEP